MGASQNSGRSNRNHPGSSEALDAGPESSPDLLPEKVRLYSASDRATEWVIYFMVVFSPWAFGTTQPWSQKVINGAGYLLGVLLAVKWLVRWSNGSSQLRSQRQQNSKSDAGPGKIPRWPMRLLAGLTVLTLGYCLVSAVNGRADFVRSEWRFDYHDCLAWLPHSYDSISTWRAFWNYLAFALAFWAVADWVHGRVDDARSEVRGKRNRADPASGTILPARLRRLLWIICTNGALLALEGILQRTSGTNKLLWLVETHMNKEAAAQFGPYAYRSNAAQYFTLIWPVSLGFWWVQHRAARFQQRPGTVHHLLLTCTMLMAAGSLISLSRAGAIIGFAGMVAAFAILAFARGTHWKEKSLVLLFLCTVLFLAWYAGWIDLAKRFNEMSPDWDPSRIKLWRLGAQMARDFPVFGTGPGTYESISQLYLDPQDPQWMGQLHNDWLETLITFGSLGFSMIVLALLTVLGRWLVVGGTPAPRVLVMFLWLALGGCLSFALVDFPFQIYSILFLFLVICAMLSRMSRKA